MVKLVSRPRPTLHVYDKQRRYALLVIDMLNDFVTGSLKTDRAKPIIPKIAGLLDAFRSRGLPVIYSNDSHEPQDFELHRWPYHAMKGSEGGHVIPELSPKKRELISEKSTYSAFYTTKLDDLLHSLYDLKGANTLILTGLHTDICIRHTTADAFFRGYEVIVPEDAVNSFTAEQHRQGLEYLKSNYIIGVMPTKNVIKKLH